MRKPNSRITARWCSWLAALAVATACGGEKPAVAAIGDAIEAGAVGFDSEPLTSDGAGSPAEVASVADSKDTIATDSGPPQLDVAIDGAALVEVANGCTPNCKGKICGSNGCGAVCGFCQSGQFCAADGSKCSGFCEKNCKDKVCGADGCNGVCGTCDSGFQCGDDFKCYAVACRGSCTGKQCGDNGCGKTCGTCAGNDFCAAGQCKANACKDIDSQKGKCEGDLLITCSGVGAAAAKVTKDCAAPPNLQNLTCGWDAAINKNACMVKQCDASCTTDGGEKIVCGPNGCGQPCGSCSDGWKCNVTACVPVEGATCTAANFPTQGQCEGKVWIYCNTGKLKYVDCVAAGMDKCGWNAAAGKFECL